MPYIVKYYLHYGFFGNQLFDAMYSGGTPVFGKMKVSQKVSKK